MTDKTTSWSESDERAIREQLSRILDSSLFSHAERLGRFLKFVVEESLDGRGARLNQYVIAIDVFDRDESFDPAIDAIVRVEAGRLRSKLLEYYDELGRDDPIRVELPKRSYAATFQFRPATELSASSTNSDTARFKGEPTQEVTFPTGPTIAVMPFANMSPDPEQEYFADGVTEDLITDLSQLPHVSVIARQSTFSYKGSAATVQQVCDELGANLVLEGSVRKVGNRIRITAQLIEGATGRHLWAQRYDHDLGNIFELQDQVNKKIVSALRLQLPDTEVKKLMHRGTVVIDAYDYVLRGMKDAQANTLEGSTRARYCFETAIKLDPNYATAYARLALNYIFHWILGWSKLREESIDKGFEIATKAVALDDQLALAHAALCWAHLWQGEHDKAIVEGRIAIELDPSDVVAHERLALSMIWAGDVESSFSLIEKAKRLNPNQTYNFAFGVARFMLQQYDAAIELLESDFELNPRFLPSGLYLASSYALVGHQREAASTVAAIRQISPDFQIAKDFRTHFKNSGDRERFVRGLRQSGLS